MNPGLSFFCPPETAAMNAKELKRKMHDRGSSIVFVVFGKVCAVPDILWGQLYKSQRSLEKLLRLSDFRVLRDFVWSDEKDINMFVFELEQRCLPLVRNHLGPPLDKDSECAKFLAKYLGNLDTVCGPFIKDGRWVVQVKRRHTDAKELLGDKLADGGRNAGVAQQISVVLRKGFHILVDDEIVEIYKKSEEFARFLTDFLIGRPRWLETS